MQLTICVYVQVLWWEMSLFKGLVCSNQLHGGRCESETAPYTDIKVLFCHNEVKLHPNTHGNQTVAILLNVCHY